MVGFKKSAQWSDLKKTETLNTHTPITRNIKLTLEYDGTDFNGWQIQLKARTVQGEIENALKKIFPPHRTADRIKLYGSGRTDAGVHALGQVANFKTHTILKTEAIRKALNANLPPDITIVNVEDVPLNFHSQYSAKSKIYRYTILNRDSRPAYARQFCLHFPYKLDVKLLSKEAKSLLGRHDFRSFGSLDKGESRENTIRHVKRIEIKKRGNYLTIDIEADGFLYKMVRNIVGTLLDVSTGRLAPRSIKKILAQKNRKFASPPAAAQGLTLLEVKF